MRTAANGSESVAAWSGREDSERARLNTLISVLASSPEEDWTPDLLDAFSGALLNGALYRQAIASRLAKVRSPEEQATLTKVDAFLTGYLTQERRRASRAKVRRGRVGQRCKLVRGRAAHQLWSGQRQTA